jgi:hypothetical protein
MKRIIWSPGAMTLISIALLCSAANLHASEPCSNATFKGSYGLNTSGTIIGVGPVAAVGELTADGKGNVTGVNTFNINGSSSHFTFTATYQVNPDCTGSAIVNGTATVHLDFVIEDNGREQVAMQTDPGAVVTTVLKKIHSNGGEEE